MPDDERPAWFITGCSSGIGRALAIKVLERGYRCAVTARDPARIADIVTAFSARAVAIPLDVTRAADVARAVEEASARFGVIDFLVNNAGYGYYAAVEEGEDAAVRDMFETNFFGLAALIRHALPGMRARRRGHVINISSVAGQIGNPGAGYYSASKAAVEGLSEALAKEVGEFGIRVTLVEPGPFRADFQGRSMKVPRTPIAAYTGTAIARRTQIAASAGRQPGDPVRAAEAIIAIAESDAPPLRVALGRSAWDRLHDKLSRQLLELEAGRDVALGADFEEDDVADRSAR